MRHAYTRAKALPADLVEAQAKANSKCEKVWRVARKNADFRMVKPHLAEVLRLTREAASALSGALGLSPYDALMDGYQQGMGAEDVEPIFAAYEDFLADRIPQVERLQARQPPPFGPPDRFLLPPSRRYAVNSRNVWAWISTMPASISPLIHFLAERRRTFESPPAISRTISPRPSWRSCTKPVMRFMNGVCQRPMRACRSGRLPVWPCMKASP